MLAARVLLMVVVVVWASFVSSHWNRLPGIHKPYRPFVRPPPLNPCCTIKCNDDEHCKVQDCGEPACFSDDPCRDLNCAATGMDCVMRVGNDNFCQAAETCRDKQCNSTTEACVVNDAGVAFCQSLSRCDDMEVAKLCPAGSACDPSINSPNCLLPVCIDGETTLNENCTFSQCLNGGQIPYTGSEAPFVPFIELIEKNCVTTDPTPRNWADARSFCQADGDLYVIRDFPGFNRFFNDFHIRYWVGGKTEGWLDGRPVADEEWDLNQPNGTGECISMLVDGKLLHNQDCQREFLPLCQRGISFQSLEHHGTFLH